MSNELDFIIWESMTIFTICVCSCNSSFIMWFASVVRFRAKPEHSSKVCLRIEVSLITQLRDSAMVLQVAAAISDAKAAISAAAVETGSSNHSAIAEQSTTATATDDTTADTSATSSSSETAHVQLAAVDVVAVSPWTEKWLAEQQQAGGRVSYQRGQATFQVCTFLVYHVVCQYDGLGVVLRVYCDQSSSWCVPEL
jgi:hypothetical protein